MVSIYLNYKYVEEDCVLYTVIGLDEAKSVNDHICFNNTLALHCWRNSSTANQKQEQRLCYGISDTEVWMHQSNSQHKRERVGQWDTLLWPFSYFIDYYVAWARWIKTQVASFMMRCCSAAFEKRERTNCCSSPRPFLQVFEKEREREISIA